MELLVQRPKLTLLISTQGFNLLMDALDGSNDFRAHVLTCQGGGLALQKNTNSANFQELIDRLFRYDDAMFESLSFDSANRALQPDLVYSFNHSLSRLVLDNSVTLSRDARLANLTP